MPVNTPEHPARTLLRWLARAGLLAFVGFWTWFLVSVMASEGLAAWPVGILAVFWLTGALAWVRPRLGAVALVAVGAAALWAFRDPGGRWNAALWLIALPAWAIACAAWPGAPRRVAGRDASPTMPG